MKAWMKQGLRDLFEFGQFAGVDILPRHFYSEIPNLRVLKKSEEWKKPFSMMGLKGIGRSSQMAFIRECCTPRLVDAVREGEVHRRASVANGEEGYGPIEADFLFCFVASKRPRQIFQIGCGVSTAVCLMAAEHVGYDPEVICVEPYLRPISRTSARTAEFA